MNLIFAVHNHQPIGNFNHVFEDVFQKAYLPFLNVLERFPSIKVSLHYTGILLEWLQKHHPEFIERLSTLIKSDQVEILGGAYYEAILSVIPPDDRLSQIKKLSDLIFKLFDCVPSGMWLAERVWEQTIVKEISQAGIKFLPIDEAHFLYAGFKEKDLYGYFITEEQGLSLFIFPGSKKLRYTIPFAPVDENIQYLKSLSAVDNNSIIVFADDGEKFGSWPNTYEHVYQNGWLEDFFKKIDENKNWLKTIHFKDALQNSKPKGTVYLPTASYPEMLKWTLPAEIALEFDEFEYSLNQAGLVSYLHFVKSGYWRNFLAKYPEANWLHKRMLRVSKLISESNVENKELVKNHLLAAQCNDAYWHGVFGGIYLPNLRYPIYKNLIRAESLINSAPKCEVTDFDCDGCEEIIISNNRYNLFIKPDSGGAVYEMDYIPAGINLLDITNRRKEYSHVKLRKKVESNTATLNEQQLAESLNYDKYRHGSFIDHFFDSGVTPYDLYKAEYSELGNFVEEKYLYKTQKLDKYTELILWREGYINSNDNKIKLIKTFKLYDDSDTVEVIYRLNNLGTEAIDINFGVELVYNLLAGDAPDRYYLIENSDLEDKSLISIGVLKGTNKLSLIDEWLGLIIELHAEEASEFWRFPIQTVSISESGYEKLYQGSIIIPCWRINLKDAWETKILQKIRMISI